MAAIGCAMMDIFANHSRTHLILLRPTIETGRSIGFLPGDVLEKITPFFGACTQALSKVAFKVPPGMVEFHALGFERGISYENCVVILDEAQNASYAQLTMLLTRLGANCKMIILGDPQQSDIRPTIDEYDCDLDACIDALDGLSGVKHIEFPDSENLRHPLIKKMIKRLNALKNGDTPATPRYGSNGQVAKK